MTASFDERPAAREDIRAAIRELCSQFPNEYWREMDLNRAYPTAFVQALTEAGWLSVLIPRDLGGGGLGISDAAAIVEEIQRSGGNAAAAHAQIYMMGTVLRHGTEAQKRRYLPKLAAGQLRLQAFGVTEPNAGSDSTRIETAAVREGDAYRVNGRKIFISRAEHSDLLLLLARTSPYSEARRTQGLSLFLVDLKTAVARKQIAIRPIKMMLNTSTTELLIHDLEIPAENLVGEEGKGFQYIIDGWNAERILIASECIGDGHWFVERASKYAGDRVVFGRPIGANQGVQFRSQGHTHRYRLHR